MTSLQNEIKHREISQDRQPLPVCVPGMQQTVDAPMQRGPVTLVGEQRQQVRLVTGSVHQPTAAAGTTRLLGKQQLLLELVV